MADKKGRKVMILEAHHEVPGAPAPEAIPAEAVDL
jgi:hypothetical protein